MPLLPHLHEFKEIYIFTGSEEKSFHKKVDVHYILVDWKHRVKTGFKDNLEFYKNQLSESKSYKITFNRDDIILYEKIKKFEKIK